VGSLPTFSGKHLYRKYKSTDFASSRTRVWHKNNVRRLGKTCCKRRLECNAKKYREKAVAFIFGNFFLLQL
jgi:3-methyladenine DNA glycosylase AlkC